MINAMEISSHVIATTLRTCGVLSNLRGKDKAIFKGHGESLCCML